MLPMQANLLLCQASCYCKIGYSTLNEIYNKLVLVKTCLVNWVLGTLRFYDNPTRSEFVATEHAHTVLLCKSFLTMPFCSFHIVVDFHKNKDKMAQNNVLEKESEENEGSKSGYVFLDILFFCKIRRIMVNGEMLDQRLNKKSIFTQFVFPCIFPHYLTIVFIKFTGFVL